MVSLNEGGKIWICISEVTKYKGMIYIVIIHGSLLIEAFPNFLINPLSVNFIYIYIQIPASVTFCHSNATKYRETSRGKLQTPQGNQMNVKGASH